MIVNVSRFITGGCWQRLFNRYHRRIGGPRSMNLVDGGAFHELVAIGMATKDWEQAFVGAHKKFDEEAALSTIPPEQDYLLEEHWQLIKRMGEVYREQYEQEEYQVLQPECEFDVALPSSHHNCILLHWRHQVSGLDHWEPPSADDIANHFVLSPHHTESPECPCWQPHRFVGKTDAVVIWKNNIWLLEHKTTAIRNEQFWNEWLLDIQPTAYMYGIHRQLGIRPRGFLLNAIYKPSESQVANWNSKRKDPKTGKSQSDYVAFEREAFLRTEEDLLRVEDQLKDFAEEWERRIVRGSFPLRNTRGTCVNYNRLCDYHAICCAHGAPREYEALQQSEPDYVDERLIQLQVAIRS